MHELKKAIEAVLNIADGTCEEPDDSLFMRLENDSSEAEFEFAIEHLRTVYEAVKGKI
jgi:hypothetical protein